MRAVKLVLPAAILTIGFMACITSTYAKPDYAKKEGKKCMYCHAKVEAKEGMSKNLNDAGKYYAAHDHSLEGYTEKK